MTKSVSDDEVMLGFPPSDSMRFPRSRRLRKRYEFSSVQRFGVRVHTRNFVVVALSRSEASDRTRTDGRFGTAISRRTGNAVVRNRVRRLLKEVFRRLPELRADVVVIAKDGAGRLAKGTLHELASEIVPGIRSALQRAERR
ncbi:MAG: ribonuclease P protein component [Deltaproteobacteria bacterium]|nr:ribonuclease P protein component [Deltaproteobacteria bacterium]